MLLGGRGEPQGSKEEKDRRRRRARFGGLAPLNQKKRNHGAPLDEKAAMTRRWRWTIFTKKKVGDTVAAAFRGIVEGGLGRFDKLVTDDGGEFYDAPFHRYVQSIGATRVSSPGLGKGGCGGKSDSNDQEIGWVAT